MWAQLINVLLGVWLLISPYILHFDGAPYTTAHVTGPIVVALAVVSCREVTRIFRFLLLLPALWLMLAPWFLHFSAGVPLANEELVAIAMTICAVLPGSRRQRIGGGWLSLLTALDPESTTLDTVARDAQKALD